MRKASSQELRILVASTVNLGCSIICALALTPGGFADNIGVDDHLKYEATSQPLQGHADAAKLDISTTRKNPGKLLQVRMSLAPIRGQADALKSIAAFEDARKSLNQKAAAAAAAATAAEAAKQAKLQNSINADRERRVPTHSVDVHIVECPPAKNSALYVHWLVLTEEWNGPMGSKWLQMQTEMNNALTNIWNQTATGTGSAMFHIVIDSTRTITEITEEDTANADSALISKGNSALERINHTKCLTFPTGSRVEVIHAKVTFQRAVNR